MTIRKSKYIQKHELAGANAKHEKEKRENLSETWARDQRSYKNPKDLIVLPRL